MDHREHSIYFNEYNTWDTWRIVPSSRPTPSIPEVQTNMVDIPGKSGSLDLSEALTGYPLFSNRSLEAQFIVLDQKRNWMDIYTDVADKLHGKRMKIKLVDDPDWYYEGRVTVTFTSNSDYSSIDISCDLDPFRYSNDLTVAEVTIGYADFDVETAGVPNRARWWLAADCGELDKDDFVGQLPTSVQTRYVYEPEVYLFSTVASTTKFTGMYHNQELNIYYSSLDLTLSTDENEVANKIPTVSNQSGTANCSFAIYRPSAFTESDTLTVRIKMREKRI